jgi:hypothetical protein
MATTGAEEEADGIAFSAPRSPPMEKSRQAPHINELAIKKRLERGFSAAG